MRTSESISDLAASLAKAQGIPDRHAESGLIPSILRQTYGPHKGNQLDGRSVHERFYAKVAWGASDCWYWWGALHGLGYGLCNLLGESKAHRVSWRIHRGDIPAGLNVLHDCDIRNCVNPDHLFLGTQRDNVHDMIAKRRHVFCTPLFGENNPMSRLTWPQVEEIRRVYGCGGISMAALAKRYGVATMTISRAVRGATWNKR